MLICPICQSSLARQLSSWQCEQGHNYDQAKQGYVNLHVVQHKHSKSPGDTPDAVQARRRFLSAGFYQPLQQKIVDVVRELQVQTALDIGCGEGYYTQAMAEHIPQLVAVDIAKSAVQLASKHDQQKRVAWVVGTGAMLPVANGSMQLCSSFFSPLPKAEMCRVLQSKGYLLLATPAPRHLYALRQALFEQVNEHQPEKFLQQLQPEFQLVQSYFVESELNLNQTQLQDLVAMTPYAYKAKAERRAMLQQYEQFVVKAEFCLYVLQRCDILSLGE